MTSLALLRATAGAAIAVMALSSPAIAQSPVAPTKSVRPAAPRIDSVTVAPLRRTPPPPAGMRAASARDAAAATRATSTSAPLAPASPGMRPDEVKAATAASLIVPPPPALRPVATSTPPSPASSPAAMQSRAEAADVPAPAGATGRCADGSYVTGIDVDAFCAGKGGVGVLFPARTAPPRRP